MTKDATRTSVDEFAVKRHLSSRGTSNVYLGTSPEGRQVVLRVFRAETTGGLVVRDRMLRKAELAKGFDYPSLVPVIDVRRDGREVICIRDFIQGADISRIAHGYRSTGERFPLSGAMVILLELLEALHYLQTAGKQGNGEPDDWHHGGITPRNVLIGALGQLHLTGFGFGELGLREASVEAWKNRRMSAMSPRWIISGRVEQEEDLFAIGAMVYGLLMAEGVYGQPDTSSPEALLELVRGWNGVDADALAERTGSKSIAAVLKRLTSPTPGANFGSAREALQVLSGLVPMWSAKERRAILEGLLDGSEKDKELSLEAEDTSPTIHPVGEGGATRSILDAGMERERGQEPNDNESTLRGASTEDLGEDFQSVKRSFGVLKAKRVKSKKSGNVVRRPEVRPKLKKNSSKTADSGPSDVTLDVDGAPVFAGTSGSGGAADSTLELDRRQIFPQGMNPHQEDLPTANTPSVLMSGGKRTIGQDDRTLDMDSARIFQEKRSDTVVRVKTPLPSNVAESLSGAANASSAEQGRQDSKINFGKAVLADRLPPISESHTFRLLVVALGVLFLLLGLLVFLWIRKMDVLRYTAVEAQSAVELDGRQDRNDQPFSPLHLGDGHDEVSAFLKES